MRLLVILALLFPALALAEDQAGDLSLPGQGAGGSEQKQPD
jgi:hypothetical protein